MIRGLYTSASGMLVEMKRTDVISNNLANASTTSFKKDQAVFRALPEMRIHRLDDPVTVGKAVMDPMPFLGVMGTGAVLDEIYTDYSQANIEVTSNPLDFAIKGAGFFVVETPAGAMYTRDGSFSVNAEGFLVTREGYEVLGEGGPVVVDAREGITVDSQGNVLQGDEVIDRLSLASFEQPTALEKTGDNLYSSEDAPIPFEGEVLQGALEDANVNIVSEMVDLIAAFRSYEASQKVLRTNDETLGRAVNDILRI